MAEVAMELHFYNGIFIFALFIVSGKQTAFYKLENAIWILLNQGIQSEQYVAWITLKSRFLKKKWWKHWLSFLTVTKAYRTFSGKKVMFLLFQKWASNNQSRSMAVGKMVDRHQSYFLIYPVDQVMWN